MNHLVLLAQRRNEDINQWLDQNPLMLGLLFVGIGILVGGWGLFELATGVSRSKHGRIVSGTQGKILSIIRVVAGAACMLFGLFKMLF